MKDLNLYITPTIKVLGLSIAMFTISYTVKSIWWLSNPLGSHIYNDTSKPTLYKTTAKEIVNRAPFGIIVKEESAVIAVNPLKDIVLTGIYAAGKDSIAFIKNGDKSDMLFIGSPVMNYTVTKMTGNQITFVSDSGDVQTIGIKTSDDNNSAASNQNNMPNNGMADNSSTNNAPSSPDVNAPDLSRNANNASTDDLVARRKNLIQQFEKNNAQQEDNN